jgi:hypothetical protein
MKRILLALLLHLLGPIGCGTIPRNPVPVEQIPKATSDCFWPIGVIRTGTVPIN